MSTASTGFSGHVEKPALRRHDAYQIKDIAKMLIETQKAVIEAFRARKKEQGLRAMAQWSPEISLIVSGEQRSQVVIRIDSDTISEGVVIGQLPHIVVETVGSKKNPVRRPASNENKPPEKREIDLTDDEVDQIIISWRQGKSALRLPFVAFVYDPAGHIRTA